MNGADFDPEEMEFCREILGGTLAGPCPHPDVVMAVQSRVFPESAEAIRIHIERCPICQQLSRDLMEYEYPAASAEEDRRIRAQWHDPPSAWRRPRVWWPILATALAVAILELTVIWNSRQPAARPIATVQPPAPAADRHRTVLALEKAGIRIPMAAVLLNRSDEKSSPFIKELAAALEPYGSSDYVGAERKLREVAAKYPEMAEPTFYLGVCGLFLGQNAQAIEALKTARRHADDSLRDAVSWYLAVALDRAGSSSDALRETGKLCGHAGEYRDKACAAVAELKAR